MNFCLGSEGEAKTMRKRQTARTSGLRGVVPPASRHEDRLPVFVPAPAPSPHASGETCEGRPARIGQARRRRYSQQPISKRCSIGAICAIRAHALPLAVLAACLLAAPLHGQIPAYTGLSVTPCKVVLHEGESQVFTATVRGNPGTVNWSSEDLTVPPEQRGSVDATGRYTAPSSISGARVVTVTASVSGVSVTAQIILQPQAVRVAIGRQPDVDTVIVGDTQVPNVQFTAAVAGQSSGITWELNPPGVGTLNGSGLYTPPGSLTGPEARVAITARSTADPARFASSRLTVRSTQVTVSIDEPKSVTLLPCLSHTFTARASGGTSNPAVSWSMDPVVGTPPSGGLYVAPASFTTVKTGVPESVRLQTLPPRGSSGCSLRFDVV